MSKKGIIRSRTTQKIEESLYQDYLETKYTTTEPPFFEIIIDKFNLELNQYLINHNITYWAFISAENPYSNKLTTKENLHRTQKLKIFLSDNNFTFIEGLGIPQNQRWIAERSYLVFDISYTEACALGRLFEQKAIVHGDLEHPPRLILL